MQVSFTVNGIPQALDVPPNTLLVDLLRQHLGLTGTHVGCDTSQCGACTVHLDGRAVKACAVLAGQVQGAAVTTIEGIGTAAALHPMQAAFRECHALQCGFCTPGMIVAAVALLEKNPHPADRQIVEAMNGNLCRCNGYPKILRAIRRAAGNP